MGLLFIFFLFFLPPLFSSHRSGCGHVGVVFLRYGDVFGAGGRARWAGVKKRRRAPNAPFLNETSKQKQPSLSFYTQDLLLDATVFLIDLVQYIEGNGWSLLVFPMGRYRVE